MHIVKIGGYRRIFANLANEAAMAAWETKIAPLSFQDDKRRDLSAWSKFTSGIGVCTNLLKAAFDAADSDAKEEIRRNMILIHRAANDGSAWKRDYYGGAPKWKWISRWNNRHKT